MPEEPNEADNLFHPFLRGRVAASEGDVWWLTWDGNPLLNNQRLHPLGLVLEQRGMGWNTPSGNQDIIYFIYTLYNITSTRVADYVGVRPAMREILLDKAREFQDRNNAAFGITLPSEGYPITSMHVAFAADMDVGTFNENYASANIPFALGYTYQRDFPQLDTWTFDPHIFGPPFFPATGFAGVKYLRSPRDSLGHRWDSPSSGRSQAARDMIRTARFSSSAISPVRPIPPSAIPRVTPETRKPATSASSTRARQAT